jgi:hypothetical protein
MFGLIHVGAKFGCGSRRKVPSEVRAKENIGRYQCVADTGLERLCYKFAKGVTESLQGFYKVGRDVDQDEKLREQIAILHLLMWHRKFTTRTISPDVAPQNTFPSSAGADAIRMSTIDSIHEVHEPSTGTDTVIDIIVNIVDHRKQPVTTVTETNRVVHFARAMPRKLLDKVEISDPTKSDMDVPRYIDASTKRRLPKEVYAQAAAPWDVLITEVGSKGIEALFAAGVILGSSGGAWLGLTMASIFPQRVAAGLYASSFGQVAAPPKIKRPIDRYTEHVFIAAGTLWVNENEEDGYCIRPCLGWR